MAKIIVRFEDIETVGPEFDAAKAFHDAMETGQRLSIAGATVIPFSEEILPSMKDCETYRGDINGVSGLRSSYKTFEFTCQIVRD